MPKSIDSFMLEEMLKLKQYKLAKMLIRQGANINNRVNGQSLIYRVISAGDVQAAALLIENKVNVNIGDAQTLMSPLHLAAELGMVDLVELLIDSGADINAKNKSEKTPIQLIISKPDDDCYKEITENLASHGALLPEEFFSKRYYCSKLPKIGVIEYYDEKESSFISDEKKIKHQIKQMNKDAVVLFFAKYESPLKSPFYGAVKQYYLPYHFAVLQQYKDISQDFNLFRIRIDNVRQIAFNLKIIKQEYLSVEQEIQHLTIHAHANNYKMRLGYTGNYQMLTANDEHDNDSAMKKSCEYLGKNATIALFGCSTAAVESVSLTKDLSVAEVTQGRVVFGVPEEVEHIFFKKSFFENRSTLIPFFSNESTKRHLVAYKNGEQIAKCEWDNSLRSRL